MGEGKSVAEGKEMCAVQLVPMANGALGKDDLHLFIDIGRINM
jgi:hypothetical protein